LALYESILERIVWIFIPFYDELKSVILIFLILSRARVCTISRSARVSIDSFYQSAEPIYLHVIRPLLKPYVSTIDAVLNFVHNLGDFILLILSLPFTAAISWWYGTSTDEDQAGLTEAESESVRSYADEQPATSTTGADYRGLRNTRPPATREESRSKRSVSGNGHIPYPRGVPRETRSSSDTLRSRFYGPPGASSQRHEIWHPPPSSHDDIDEDRAEYPENVPPVAMPEPGIPAIAVDDWPMYPPFPSAYPPTPVHPSQINMPEPVHPSQFGIVQEGTGGAVASNDQNDGAQPGFGRSLLPPREPLNPGSDGDLSDETKNPRVHIHETRYVTSSDSDEDMEDYETEEDSFDVTFQTPKHQRILRAMPMGREVSNFSIDTEATVASSVPSEMTGLTTDHHASSLRTTTLTVSRSSSSSAAGVKRPFPNYKIGVRPRIRVADHRSPRKAGPARGTGRFTALPRPASLRPQRGGTVSEDTLDDEDRKDADALQGDDALLSRKRQRVATMPGARRTVASRPPVRGPRNGCQSLGSRPAQDSRKTRIAKPPVATKTSLRVVDPRVTKSAAASSGSTASRGRAHQPVKRRVAGGGNPFLP
jgi:hypothetical protein